MQLQGVGAMLTHSSRDSTDTETEREAVCGTASEPGSGESRMLVLTSASHSGWSYVHSGWVLPQLDLSGNAPIRHIPECFHGDSESCQVNEMSQHVSDNIVR